MKLNTLILLVLFGLAVYIFYRKAKHSRKQAEKKRLETEKRKEEEKERMHRKQRSALIPFLPKVSKFENDFNKFITQEKYISNYEIFRFRQTADSLYHKLKIKKYNHLPEFKNEIRQLDTFIRTYENLDSLIKVRNQDFITSEIQNTAELLGNVENKALDDQQRRAVIIDEDTQLVIAGAGSGKTTTIVGKVKYLIERQHVDPRSILLISFTRKSANEMNERIKATLGLELEVKTFNKLGLDIIADANEERPTVYVSSGKKHLEIINSFIKHLKNDEEYFELLLDFVSYYLKPYKDINLFGSDSDHNNYLNEQKLEGYKMVSKFKNGIEIKYRERLKSQEEVLIANFLFRNGIEYEYEEKYEYKTASRTFGQYKPDFYIPFYNIYIEHFGVDENWNVPDWFKGKNGKTAKEVYNEGITWKRQEHAKNQTKLIETYSWQQRKGVLLSELQRILEAEGVVFNPIPNEELWSYLEENARKDVNDFTELINTFLVLFKSNNANIHEIKSKAKTENNERAIKFLSLFEPVYNLYEAYLSVEEEIDFSDMINKATQIIQSDRFHSPYDYILIDEYQDISKARYELIKSLLDCKLDTKLFCVGDDWQSIFRFAGSDIGFFTKFEEKFRSSPEQGFSRSTNTSFIEYTYRFDNQLINLSSHFILKNPNQIRKNLKSHSNSEDTPYTITGYQDPESNNSNLSRALKDALANISERSQGEEVSVLLVGRYNYERRNFIKDKFLVERYNNELEQYEYSAEDFPNLKIRFLTAHRSKGLQDDYVVITNCSSGTYGFPSEISDDPLLSYLLSEADHYPNGEERRLFYVAMTRAKKHLYFLVNADYPSKFLNEIVSLKKTIALQCPWCENGNLLERNGPHGLFFACNNYHYCNFTRKTEARDYEFLATEFYLEREYDKAIENLEKYLSTEIGNSDIYTKIGKCYKELKDNENALLYFDKAIDCASPLPDAFYYRGILKYNSGEYASAIEDWLEFKNVGQYESNVNTWLAHAYLKSRYLIKSIEYINLELERKPNDKYTKKVKAMIQAEVKDRLTRTQNMIKSNDIQAMKEYIQLAIDFSLNIKFDYFKSIHFDGGVKSLRTIKPSGFKTIGTQDTLCLYGYCYMREEERTFNLDRISKLVINPNEIEFWSE